MFYPALLNLPDDELVMITDMDMLPTNDIYYKSNLDNFKLDDFIYYRHIDGNQIYMCYNAAHPKTWGKVFGINNSDDIKKILYDNYVNNYNGISGSIGWYKDQELMYSKLFNYENLKVLNRPLKRLEVYMYKYHLQNNNTNFINHYDDCHFHRNFLLNETLILDAQKQLNITRK